MSDDALLRSWWWHHRLKLFVFYIFWFPQKQHLKICKKYGDVTWIFWDFFQFHKKFLSLLHNAKATDVYLANDDQRQNGDPNTNLKSFFRVIPWHAWDAGIAFRTHDEMSMQNTTRWWVFAIQYSTPKLFFLQTLPGSSYRGTKITRPDNLKLCVRNISLVKAIHSNKWNNIQPNR